MRLNFFRKKSFWRKKPNDSSKIEYFGFFFKNAVNQSDYSLLLSPVLQEGPGLCDQVDLLSNQITGFFDHQYLRMQSIEILDFCMMIIFNGRCHQRLPLLVACDYLSLSSNYFAVFFHHQFLWKESIYVLVLLDGVSYQGKVLPLMVGCSQLCLLSNQIVEFFDRQYLEITN